VVTLSLFASGVEKSLWCIVIIGVRQMFGVQYGVIARIPLGRPPM